MATCPECHAAYADDVRVCPEDGTELVADALFAAADKDVPAGQLIGEYKVESKLGEGGFGVVYRAVHPVIGKHAAIKVLSRRFSSDPEMVSRFIAEARAANRIQNKNIIDIFAFGALSDGRQYYVMELLEGVTLDEYLSQKGRLSIEEATPILLGIARALDAAHAAGVAHRDLKPENVFLATDEERGFNPKLLDFGIAKLFGDAPREHRTRTGVPMGTPHYMSPEQCRGKQVDSRTDIYSFGVLTFQLLTGQLPFTGESFMDVMLKHISSELPLASGSGCGIGPEFDGPIAHMMQKDPAARPRSAVAAVEELAEAARLAGHAVAPVRSTSVRVGPIGSSAPPQGCATLESADTLAQATTESGNTPMHRLSEPKRGRAWGFGVAIMAVGGVATTALLVSHAHGRNDARLSASAAPAVSSTAPASASAALTGAPSASGSTPPSVAPAPPAEILLHVQSVPKGVDVYLGDRLLGSAPGPLHLRRGKRKVELVLKAKGYVPRKVQFMPSEDGVISAMLQKRPHQALHRSTGQHRKPKTPADLEF